MPLAPRPSTNFQNEAFTFIYQGEGFRPGVYGDSIGVPTVGYGYAMAVRAARCGPSNRRSPRICSLRVSL